MLLCRPLIICMISRDLSLLKTRDGFVFAPLKSRVCRIPIPPTRKGSCIESGAGEAFKRCIQRRCDFCSAFECRKSSTFSRIHKPGVLISLANATADPNVWSASLEGSDDHFQDHSRLILFECRIQDYCSSKQARLAKLCEWCLEAPINGVGLTRNSEQELTPGDV